jgi:glutamate racemase
MKKSARRPIGVFDSGIGGLTVFKELARRLPEEDLIYFGDTAHIPYGSKTPQAVQRYSLAVARFLEQQGIKAMVVACNTSSALALPVLQKSLKVPVIGVIEPGARAAARVSRGGAIGVIGTEATVNSGAYVKALKRVLARPKTISQACPLFVPLIEEGWWSHPATAGVAREYLAALKTRRLDTLILGCTHYPLLKDILTRILGRGVALVDPARETALETERMLESRNLRRRGGKGRRVFYVSDASKRFLKVARRLGVAVKSVRLHPFDI